MAGPAPTHAARSKELLREAVLDAAYDVVVGSGWASARMGGIAARAGVSRQTVYNEFGSKSGVASALLMRETHRFLDGVAQTLATYPGDPATGIAEAVAYTLRRAADNPLLKTVLTSARHDEFLELLTTRSAPTLWASVEAVTDYLHTQWPDLDRESVALVAESAVRLTNSHIVLPTEPVDVTARRISALVYGYLQSKEGSS